MVDVFLSYTSRDRETVRRLIEAFDTFGLVIWWDRGRADHGLIAGQRYDREIERNLKVAKSVAVIWSTKSVESDWVFGEAERARSQKKLVAALIEECDIPIQFSRIEAAKLMDWNGEIAHDGFQSLLNGINSTIVSSGGGAKQPPADTPWSLTLDKFEWFGARFTIRHGEISHSVEYRNHFKNETIYLNGRAILHGGSESVLHPWFQFSLKGHGSHTCRIEPVYGIFGKLFTARLAKLRVSVDGWLLREITRSDKGG